MDAIVYDIVGRLDQLGWASPNDFALGPGKVVSESILSEEPSWSLYTFDKETNCAWFVEIPDDVDLSHSAFVYLDQHKFARRVLRVPFDSLRGMAEKIPTPLHIIFIFSVGRCGSTLVSQILNTVPGVWSLSEPEAYPRLIMENYNSQARLDYPREQLIKLIRLSTILLFRPPLNSNSSVFSVKLHSQSIFQADLFYEAFPEASYVFLYRDALSWANSFFQMARKYGFPAVLAGGEKTAIWNTVTAAEDITKLRPYIDLDADSVPLEDGLVLGWACCLEEYTKHLRGGVPFLALRYNELNADRVKSLAHLFEHCGLPPNMASAALAGFDKESQSGTILSRDVKADMLTETQLRRLGGVLARHPDFGDANLRLRDIYS